MVSKERKAELIEKFGGSNKDSGRAEAQVAILTERIQDLTRHMSSHRKDHHTRRGLINLVSKRRKLLDYLTAKDINRYRKIVSDLSLRK